MEFAFSVPCKTSIFSQSDIVSISLDNLAFGFCLIADGIKFMRESKSEIFLKTGLSRNFQLYIEVNKSNRVKAF